MGATIVVWGIFFNVYKISVKEHFKLICYNTKMFSSQHQKDQIIKYIFGNSRSSLKHFQNIWILKFLFIFTYLHLEITKQSFGNLGRPKTYL